MLTCMSGLRPTINRVGLSRRERILPALVGVAVVAGWIYLSGWFVVNGDELHADWDGGSCYTGSPTWAYAQGAIALAGVLCAIPGLVQFVRRSDTNPTAGRGLLRAAGALLVLWFAVAFIFDPRDSLGIYGGCGLG